MAPKLPPPAATVSGIVARLQQAPSRGRGRRSPVVLWLRQNRADLEAAFAVNAPAWGVIAAYLAESGIMSGDGSPPKAVTVRSAWLRVKAEAKKKAPAASGAPSPSVVQPIEPPRPAPAAPVAPAAADAWTTPHSRFPGPARLRNHASAEPPPPAPVPPPMQTATPQRTEDVVAALLSRGRPTGFRKPEPQDE